MAGWLRVGDWTCVDEMMDSMWPVMCLNGRMNE